MDELKEMFAILQDCIQKIFNRSYTNELTLRIIAKSVGEELDPENPEPLIRRVKELAAKETA